MLPNDDIVKSPMLDALTHATTGVLCAKCCVGLVGLPFVPAKDGALPDDFAPDFPGYGPKERPAVDAEIVTDPVTGRTRVRLPSPVGGWTFTATGDPDSPVSVYGYYVTIGVEDADPQSPCTASALFDEPIIISEGGDQIVIGDIHLDMVEVYMV